MFMKKNIRKMLLPAALVFVLTMALAVTAMAELVPALKDYHVSYKGGNSLTSDFKKADIYNEASNLQPGDHTEIVMNLSNDYDQAVDWYMTNKVLQTLEETRADQEGLAGGAYTYRLVYKSNKAGVEPRTLFDSDMVGGENISAAGEGLHEATNALEDWLYLDSYSKGDGGVLTLTVALDGETQGNDYQDTLAELQMNFAVELREPEGGQNNPPKENTTTTTRRTSSSSSSTTTNRVVRTGDYTSMLPYLIAAGVSGLVLLILAIYSLRERRRQRGGRA